MLIVTSTRQTPTATAISAYDTVVQGDVTDTGHTAITSYATGFKMLGCTQTTSAIANTATASTDTSAPIYWLNGQKVADDYADLYDDSWDSNEPRLPDGTILTAFGFAARTSTGCDSDGTIHSTNYLGADEVIQGVPVESGAELSQDRTANTNLRRYYGLSPIFQVEGGSTNTAPTASNGTVNTTVNTAYTFDAGDFNFLDTDSGDVLEKVKIVTVKGAEIMGHWGGVIVYH